MTTMKDVAKAAGVSLSTVSYALNQNRPISQETRERVLAAIEELGYTRNAAARTLAGDRSHVLALILPPSVEGFGATIWQFVESAAAAAEEHGYSLVIWPFSRGESDKVDRLIRQRLADGVLVMEIALDDERVDALVKARVPFTMIGRTGRLEGLSWVDIDFESVVTVALDRLTALGHSHIALLNHSPSQVEGRYGAAIWTRDAFLDQAARRGLQAFHLPCDETALAGHEAAGAILGHDPATTAVITLNETATIGLIAGFMARGVAVPDQVSLIGLATSPAVATMSVPPLTALQAPSRDLGRTAVQELIEVLGNEPRHDRPRLLPCPFIKGGSLAPAHQTPSPSPHD